MKETIEEFADKTYPYYGDTELREAVIIGANWQSERSYSEEDLKQAYLDGCEIQLNNIYHLDKWFKKFKKK
jgi:hypothetical protein